MEVKLKVCTVQATLTVKFLIKTDNPEQSVSETVMLTVVVPTSLGLFDYRVKVVPERVRKFSAFKIGLNEYVHVPQ